MTEKRYDFETNEATRESLILRAAIGGPSGSGKTKTGLMIASRMVERLGLGPLFVVDSENRSALRYAYSSKSRTGFHFKHVPMHEDDYSPQAYMAAIEHCERQGAGVIMIDSFSHAWMGINGALAQVDAAGGSNKFTNGWGKVTPIYARLIQRLQDTSAHMIWTLRAKMEYVVTENDKGKKEPIKVGLAPVARDGIEYESDLYFDMTVPAHDLIVGKSRCDKLEVGEIFKRPGVEFADVLIDWIEDAEPATGARTLGEAIQIATLEGLDAAEKKNPALYVAAREKLTAWCRKAGVSAARHDEAQAQLKERVAASAQGQRNGTAAAPNGAAREIGEEG